MFPIAFPHAAFSAVATHLGTNYDTAAIITNLRTDAVNVAVGMKSSCQGYLVSIGW